MGDMYQGTYRKDLASGIIEVGAAHPKALRDAVKKDEVGVVCHVA